MYHHLPKYMSWNPDPDRWAVDSLQHSLRNPYGYTFTPFCLIGKVFAKVRKDQSLLLIVALSISNYLSVWRKWASWCYEREVNAFISNVIDILNFLAFLYEKGYEYSSINSHRSGISAYHVHIDNNPIGQHPKVCTSMTGIFNDRLPKPRYTFVWDIETDTFKLFLQITSQIKFVNKSIIS